MSELLGRLLPTAIVATVVAWCCWPYLVDRHSELDLGQDGNVPVVASSLLSPSFVPQAQRNPFELASDQSSPTATQTALSTIGNLFSLLAAESKAPTETTRAPATEPDLIQLAKGISLEATYCRGDRRVALIDGRLYEQGDSLSLSNSLDVPCVVARISSHAVLLRQGAQAAQLTYSDLASAAGVDGTFQTECSSAENNCPQSNTEPQAHQKSVPL